MEKTIEINIKNKNDLIDKYNEKKLSDELLEYIIKQAILIKKDEKIRIVINKKCDINIDCLKLIKETLKEEYKRSLEERNANNIKQFVFLILGSVFIFLSTLIQNRGLWREILLIIGWVPIWKMIELEIFPDAYGRKERKIIKKLLNSEIIEKTLEK